ncbi:MAG: hypothetical protein WA843_03790 [Candidatus Saccharimonadales bacterium]
MNSITETEPAINLEAYQVWIGYNKSAVTQQGITLAQYLGKTFLYPALKPNVEPDEPDFPGSTNLYFQVDRALQDSPGIVGNQMYFASLAVKATSDERGYSLYSVAERRDQTLMPSQREPLARTALVSIIAEPSMVGSFALETVLRRSRRDSRNERSSIISLLVISERDTVKISSGNSPLYEITYNGHTGLSVRPEEDNDDDQGSRDREPRTPIMPSGGAAAKAKKSA